MGGPVQRMFLGGLVGTVAGVIVTIVGSLLLALAGLSVSLTGNVKGPGAAGAAAIGLIVILLAGGLICGAIGGAIRRPWWGAAAGASLVALLLLGLLGFMLYEKHRELQKIREDFSESPGRLEKGERDGVLRQQIAWHEVRWKGRMAVSPVSIGVFLTPCATAGLAGGWLGRRLYARRHGGPGPLPAP